MSSNFKKFVGAGLLSLAVVGGVSTYLISTLQPAPAVQAEENVTTDQPVYTVRHAEVIVTEGPAS